MHRCDLALHNILQKYFANSRSKTGTAVFTVNEEVLAINLDLVRSGKGFVVGDFDGLNLHLFKASLIMRTSSTLSRVSRLLRTGWFGS